MILSVQHLDQFLQSVEVRAFKMAVMAVHNDADALDIVQDTMMKLVQKYADRPEQEWRPLFFTILQNQITDWHRKQNRTKHWFTWGKNKQTDEADDTVEVVEGVDDITPDQVMEQHQHQEAMLEVIETLPIKQQQCFLLRCWEGMSVEQTAEVMAVSTGSVKTHYHRAVQKLQLAMNAWQEGSGHE